jgi:hypothetical protein
VNIRREQWQWSEGDHDNLRKNQQEETPNQRKKTTLQAQPSEEKKQ